MKITFAGFLLAISTVLFSFPALSAENPSPKDPQQIVKKTSGEKESKPAQFTPAKLGKPGVYRIVRALEGPHKGNLVADLGFAAYFQLGNMGEFTAGDLIFAEPVKQSSKGLASRFHFKRVFSVQSQQKLHVSLGVEYIIGDESMLYTYAANVIRVVDGDTLDVVIDLGFGITLIHKLRLRGIDAPELDTPEGVAAKEYLEQLLKPFPKILFKSSRPDKYGRYLADIWAGDIYVNQNLLDSGHAVVMNS